MISFLIALMETKLIYKLPELLHHYITETGLSNAFKCKSTTIDFFGAKLS